MLIHSLLMLYALFIYSFAFWYSFVNSSCVIYHTDAFLYLLYHYMYIYICFHTTQQFQLAVETGRQSHLARISNNTDDEATTIRIVNEMSDQLALYSVSHDLYAENNAPPSRLDLYQRLETHIAEIYRGRDDEKINNDSNNDNGNSDGSNNSDNRHHCSFDRNTLDNVILGGRVAMPPSLLRQCNPTIDIDSIPTSQSSPEYKSPPPPNELYHSLPPPTHGKDDADSSIRLLLDGVLKNPCASSNAVIVPLVSDIGQSATSIHVHVNITNQQAWPRQNHTSLIKNGQLSFDLEATNSLLCVVFGWICFDQVVSNYFCMPNMIRDRSIAPMYASGPEFVWLEHSWDQGSFVVVPSEDSDDDGNGGGGGEVKDVKLYNVLEYFRHIFTCYNSNSTNDNVVDDDSNVMKKNMDSNDACDLVEEEKKDGEPIASTNTTSLFEQIFDHEVISNTISRWNSLNLMSLKPYGTIEFRRMHATLDADFVSAWTWFCVGFVERFSDPKMFDRFLYPFLVNEGRDGNAANNSGGTAAAAADGVDNGDWKIGLERLIHAQNHATIEDLLEIMCDESDPIVPLDTLSILMGDKKKIGDDVLGKVSH